MVNFQNGKIYAVRSNHTEKIYIGSTAQTLSRRMSVHRNQPTRCSSREIMQYSDAYIELIEEFPCRNKMELNKREGEIIRATVDCVNKRIAGRSQQEWYDEHDGYNKEYRQKNKANLNDKQRSKYYNSKTTITCVCGVEYNSGHTGSRNQHYRSQFHQHFLQRFYDYYGR